MPVTNIDPRNTASACSVKGRGICPSVDNYAGILPYISLLSTARRYPLCQSLTAPVICA